MRRLLYRPDRGMAPCTGLGVHPLKPDDGWCDDPSDASYNRAVTLPYCASAEALWREDALYDLIVILGHNDEPVTPGAGSAIFLHPTWPDFAPTEGCIALTRPDLIDLLARAGPGDSVAICA